MKWYMIVLFALCIPGVAAFNYSSGTYTGELTIIDSGGTNVTSGTYSTDLALSQLAYENISSGTYVTQLGVFGEVTVTGAVNVTEEEEEEEEEEEAVSPPGGGGGGLPMYIVDKCKTVVEPQEIFFEIDETERIINISNNATYDTYVEIFVPSVPTLFGNKDFLYVNESIFHLLQGEHKEIIVGLTGNDINQINIALTVNTINCKIELPVVIPEIFIFYDVIIKVDKTFYFKGDMLNADITIENKGDIPDTDTQLRFYILNPNNEIIHEQEEIFYEVDIGKTELKKLSQDVISAMTKGGLHFKLERGYRLRSMQKEYDSSRITVAEVISPGKKGGGWSLI